MRDTETKFDLPIVSGYYGTGNYGTHALCVSIGGIDLYYSYKTIVAYREPQDGLVVSENDWGPTTGKHLNAIDGGYKRGRLLREDFIKKLEAMLERRLGSGHAQIPLE